MVKRFMAIDLHGPIYVWTKEKGLNYTSGITKEQAAAAEVFYEKVCRDFNKCNNGIYQQGVLALEGKAPINELLKLEYALLQSILNGSYNSCGVTLNIEAGKVMTEFLQDENNKVIILSTSFEETSQIIVRETVREYLYQSRSDKRDVSPLEKVLNQVIYVNLGNYGSKKDPISWEKALENVIINSHEKDNSQLLAIIEDNDEKRSAALAGANKVMQKYGLSWNMKNFGEINQNFTKNVF